MLSSDFVKECFDVKKTLIGNDEFLDFLGRYYPIKIHKFESGTQVFDWSIPKKWKVKKAQLRKLSGDVVIDYEKNNLNLMTYSSSFSGILKKEKLKDHLFYKAENLEAIPWVHSYYAKNWGFCISKKQYDDLTEKKYVVDIQTEFIDDFLNIAELEIKGESDRQVVLTSYTCHPQMASDNLSGILLLLDLYNRLKDRQLKYTYKFFFFPETIGSLTLLASGLLDRDKVEYALIGTCVGTGEEINYKKTFLGRHSIDFVVEDILSNVDNVKIREYWPTGGSDERQLSSPKIRIPTGTIMRIPYGEYDEYHTSLDNLDLMSIEKIEKMSKIHEDVILEYEKYPKYVVCHHGGEPFLTKYNLYRTIGGTHQNYDHEAIRSWVLFLADGKNNVKDMSKKSGFSEKKIQETVNILSKSEIIKEV
jgi:aminopeptidase-like protein